MSTRFDAASDRISITAALPNPTDGITLTAWAYVSVNTATNATLVRLWTDAGATTSVTFATDADGLSGPGYFTGGGSVVATTDLAVAAWRKVAFTRLGTTAHVYVATVGSVTEDVSGTVGGAANPTGLTLGGRSPGDASESYNGRLAYVRVWSSVHSQAQVEAEWASTTPVVTSGIWADWPLTDATDLTDHSGNGRHLTAGTTAVTTEDDPPLAANVTGTALAALGGTATVIGVRDVVATATGTLGGLLATGGGTRDVHATAALGVASTAVAFGARETFGTANGALGGLHATITLAGPLPSARLRLAGREPTTRAAGREPREAI